MTQMFHSTNSSQEQLNIICQRLMLQPDKLLIALGVMDYNITNKRIEMPCPIHCGDNLNGLSIYTNGEPCFGYWRCFTHQCEKIFQPTILGFIRGVLSRVQNQWSNPGDKIITFPQVIKFALDFLNEKKLPHIDPYDANKIDFTKYVNKLNGSKPTPPFSMTRKKVRSLLKIPAAYYLTKGYTQEVLDKFDVGLCNDGYKPMCDRVVVPIYDDSYKYMIGCTGRSINPQCPTCHTWHHPDMNCPIGEDRRLYPKWKHSYGFSTEHYLYNIWNAKEHIKTTQTAIIVESPGNVWKLDEAGVYNAVGLFGDDLSENQRFILDGSGAFNLVLILDNDQAGHKAVNNITEQCKNLYNIKSIVPPKNDLGDMTRQEILDIIVPQL